MIYFDNSATSYYKPNIVKNAVITAMNTLTANPGRSGHILSQKAGEMVFETREKVKRFFNANNHQLIFTKNCTEALNLALFGFLKPGDHVITSCYEHNSVLRPLEKLKSAGVEVDILTSDLSNFDIEIKPHIKSNTKLIVVTGMSNVTGESPNLSEIGKICHQNHIIFMVDGAQSSGHINIDMQQMDIDVYAFAGHKGLCAITGVGGLIVNENLNLTPLLYGGTGSMSDSLVQPDDLPEGFEAGTLPTIPIASLYAGVDFLINNFDNITQKEDDLSQYMYQKLSKLENIKLYSSANSKNIYSFNIVGKDSGQVADILNEKYGICVRSGLHCAPLIHKKLGSLQTGAVRASIDFSNSRHEIDVFMKAIEEIAKDC